MRIITGARNHESHVICVKKKKPRPFSCPLKREEPGIQMVDQYTYSVSSKIGSMGRLRELNGNFDITLRGRNKTAEELKGQNKCRSSRGPVQLRNCFFSPPCHGPPVSSYGVLWLDGEDHGLYPVQLPPWHHDVSRSLELNWQKPCRGLVLEPGEKIEDSATNKLK